MDEVIRILGIAMVPVTGLITFFITRRDKSLKTKRAAATDAVIALTEANHTFADMVAGQLKPFQDQIDAQARKQYETDIRLAANEKLLLVHERKIAAFVAYTKALRQQSWDHGIEPLSPPVELMEHFTHPSTPYQPPPEGTQPE